MEQNWTKTFLNFLKIDTTNPPGRNYEAALRFLAPHLKKAGFNLEWVRFPASVAAKRVNLLAHCRRSGQPRLLAYSHVDVVPADEDWGPFQPKIKAGRVLARGAADMKGSILAFLLAAENLKDKVLPWDLTWLLTTDEETDQKAQLEYLFGQKLDCLEGACFLDLDSTFGYVNIGGLGDIAVRIVVKGKAVHSGISHLGRNAVEDSLEILNVLRRLKGKIEKRFSRVPVNPELRIKTMQAKLNINQINGGLKVNIVPDKCEILVDRRLIPEEKLGAARQEILAVLAPLKKKIDFTIEFLTAMPGYGQDSPLAEKLSRSTERILGRGPKFGVMGSGDIFAFARQYRWQIAGCGVCRDKESNMHGRNENVRIQDIEDLRRILEIFLLGES